MCFVKYEKPGSLAQHGWTRCIFCEQGDEIIPSPNVGREFKFERTGFWVNLYRCGASTEFINQDHAAACHRFLDSLELSPYPLRRPFNAFPVPGRQTRHVERTFA